MNNWDEIVDILSIYITNDTSEGNYQREIVNCLRMLGWRSKEGTLKEQVTLHIGNNNSIRPDIVLYKDNLPVLPIEIKRPTNISSSKEEKQLMSYMRQLKLNIGLYIGNNIQLYYDDPSDIDLPVCVLKAEFTENDRNGISLCKMLSYDTFNLNEIEENCKRLYENNINKNCLQNKLNDFLSAENIINNIKTLIKNKFMAEGFDEELLESELKDFSIELKSNKTISNHTEAKPFINIKHNQNYNDDKKKTQFSIDGVIYFGVGPFVHHVVKQYVMDHPNITFEELKSIFPPRLSQGKYGVIVTLSSFEKLLLTQPDLENRFFCKKERIILLKDNTAVVVYSQWGNSGYIKQYFQGFLKYIGTIYKVYQR